MVRAPRNAASRHRGWWLALAARLVLVRLLRCPQDLAQRNGERVAASKARSFVYDDKRLRGHGRLAFVRLAFAHRMVTACRAASLRWRAVIVLSRAKPPRLPSATAAGSFAFSMYCWPRAFPTA